MLFSSSTCMQHIVQSVYIIQWIYLLCISMFPVSGSVDSACKLNMFINGAGNAYHYERRSNAFWHVTVT